MSRQKVDARGGGVNKTCPQCGNEFTPRRHNQRFCSQPCKWTFTNQNRTLKPNFNGDCIVCGKSFSRYVEPSKLAAGLATNQYCSRPCKGKALSAENHPMWKGGRIIEADGYVMIFCPDHPNANNKGYMFEHRLVMENQIGRYLLSHEVVHHRDENRSNNDPLNLFLYDSNADHKRDDIILRDRDEVGRLLPKKKESENE